MFLSLTTRSKLMSLPVIGRLISLAKFSRKGHYLVQTGWFHSSATYSSIDAARNPLPWLTYPAIDFLTPRIQSTFRVFEYGSGNSTLWWAARVQQVTAVENNPAWAAHVTAQLQATPHATLLLETSPAAYTAAAQAQNTKFDIIVIDGAHRAECTAPALASLTPNGVIIWDNSDRPEYAPGFAILKQAGFKQLPFTGLAPVNSNRMETSIFYRPTNCLGI